MPRMNVAGTFSGGKYATESFVKAFVNKDCTKLTMLEPTTLY